MNCLFAAAANATALPSAGSPLWQLVFVSFACVVILLEVLRGWRRGLPRQLARLGGLIAAYVVAYYGGQWIGPWARPVLQMPDAVLNVVVGAILGIVVYAAINGLGTILFKRTRQHDSVMVRMVFGATGAFLGLFFGAFLIWMVIVAIRSLGAIADAQVRQQPVGPATLSADRPLHTVDLRHPTLNQPTDSTPLLTSIARLKNSLELGAVGSAVKKADVVPASAYDTLGRLGRVFSDPENAQRFLSFPGARELADNPKIVELRGDQEIIGLIEQGRMFDLLQNQKIIAAANDPEVIERVKHFDLRAALDYAMRRD
jgi:uncharacterized membrane protein required for colicin V production